MRNFDRLQEQVEDGTLRMIQIESVPRSVSTAFARALNESDTPSVYVNEPFNRYQRDVDVAAGHILDATDPITRKTDEPLTVVTKSTSRNLSTGNFLDWMTVSDGVAWTVRHPLVQLGSLVTRIANDLFIEPEADVLKQHDLTPEHLAAVDDFLLHGPTDPTTKHATNHPGSSNYSKTSWQDIGDHFRSGSYDPNHSVVVDAVEFTERPAEVLQRACGALGLRYGDRMVAGWQNGIINANAGYSVVERDASELAWTNHAATSKGIEAVSRDSLVLDQLPAAMQDHLTQVAIPTYQEMVTYGR
jgi:hypothetical protein